MEVTQTQILGEQLAQVGPFKVGGKITPQPLPNPSQKNFLQGTTEIQIQNYKVMIPTELFERAHISGNIGVKVDGEYYFDINRPTEGYWPDRPKL